MPRPTSTNTDWLKYVAILAFWLVLGVAIVRACSSVRVGFAGFAEQLG